MKHIKDIKLLILDVDGTLTNGIIYYGNNNMEMRGFHVHDGMGIKLLQKSGVDVAIISAKKSELVEKRLADLKIKHVYLGFENKLPIYESLKKELNLTDNEVAYMGDDLTDLAIIQQCGFGVCPPNSPLVMHQHCDHVTDKKAGKGAVRELCQLIMQTQGTYDSIIASYLSD